MLVVPHPEDQDFAKLDGVTSLQQDADKSTFRSVCDGGSVNIDIARDGQWEVIR